MTPEELKKIGIHSTGSKLKPREFFIPSYGDVIIPQYYKIEDIYRMIYEKGYEAGTQKGKELKAQEIKNCLGIDTEH